ncbi:MAG: hypothetical protein ACK4WH_02875 [Phycisphaerales bacterium]
MMTTTFILAAAFALPAHADAPQPSTAARVPMVLIDAQLRARPIGLVRYSSPADGRAGELVFTEQGSESPVTLPARQVLALAGSGWIVDPLSSSPPAPAAVPSGPTTARTPAVVEAVPPTDPTAANQPAPLSNFRPWVRMVDGQRLVGFPARAVDAADPAADAKPDDGQTLLWLHNRLGMLRLPVESISSLVLRPSPAPTAGPTATSDQVVLANGDRLTGFVDSIGEVVTISPPKGAAKPARTEPTRIPIDQIAQIHLANPPEPARGGMVWLSDGSIVGAAAADIDAATKRALLVGARPSASGAKKQAGGSGSFDVGEFRALAVEAARLTPLAALPIAEQRAWPGRSHFDPVIIAPTSPTLGSPLGADDLVLPGPMTVSWTLPAGSSRLSGWLVLEERSWAWGDCEVTFTAAPPDGPERVLARARLNASAPVAPFIAELPARSRLTVSVDPGEHGPVQDRVVIRHALVGIEPPD